MVTVRVGKTWARATRVAASPASATSVVRRVSMRLLRRLRLAESVLGGRVARKFQRGQSLAKRLHRRNLFPKRTRGQLATPLLLAGMEIGPVGIGHLLGHD